MEQNALILARLKNQNTPALVESVLFCDKYKKGKQMRYTPRESFFFWIFFGASTNYRLALNLSQKAWKTTSRGQKEGLF